MRVYLYKDVEKIGLAGEVIKVSDGYAKNFLIPRKFGIQITQSNEAFFAGQHKKVEHRKDVIATKTSMLAEHIRQLKIVIKKKMHDDGKLYGAVSPAEVVDALSAHNVSITKSQVKFDKSIKSKGTFQVTIKLTSRLQPSITVNIVAE